jgi:signal transduction histidine kinase
MIETSPRRAEILIVDDTVANLQLLTTMLEEQGYSARPVPGGKLALQAATASPPDLILLDINMPEMNGIEVCERLGALEETKDIPVIFLSALNETADKVKAFAAGGVDYVTKPFRFEEVRARVETHLALRRLRVELEEKNRSLEQSLARQRELERIKERLVQMIVHDLKNPLAAILGNSAYAFDELPKGTDAAEAVRDVADSAQAMHRMVLNILDVMQLEQQELRLRQTEVDLRQLAEAAVRTIRPLADKTGHAVQLEARPDMPTVVLDRDLMQRVLENLLDNALKYAPRGTPVGVDVDLSQEHGIAIDVRDRGPGVPDSERARVFDVYARLDRDRDVEAGKSRGLGLTFCKMAVEAHGGTIWIEDNQPQGAVFRIRIPGTVPDADPPGKGGGEG